MINQETSVQTQVVYGIETLFRAADVPVSSQESLCSQFAL